MTRLLRLSTVTLAVFLGSLSVVGAAAAQGGPASRYLKRKHDQAERVLRRAASTDAAREQRRAQLDALIGGLLDYEAVSREALGDTWTERSEAERAEFVSLLRSLVERNYQQNLERSLRFQVRWGDEARRGQDVVVQTSARSRENRRAPEVTIEYRMRQAGDRWLVVDVVTDGVSMVRNYRNQFSRIIRRDGWDGLLSRMRSRLEEEAEN